MPKRVDAERLTDIVYRAFSRHCRQHHGADYEVCENSVCQVAYMIEMRLYDKSVFPFVP